MMTPLKEALLVTTLPSDFLENAEVWINTERLNLPCVSLWRSQTQLTDRLWQILAQLLTAKHLYCQWTSNHLPVPFFFIATHMQRITNLKFYLRFHHKKSFHWLMGLDTFHRLTSQQVHHPTETKTVCYYIQVLVFIYI